MNRADSPLKLYNTLTREKAEFQPINPPFVGLYVCGPTVYGDPHLGHARSAVTFDLLFRWLKFTGHRVRYVRNITDVGHLLHDADSGEDKIGKLAALERVEPMEIAQRYTLSYQREMEKLGVLPPSIEPRASGHIIEQIEMVKQIIDAGFAYEVNGSVYFDVAAYNIKHAYGKLSGRVVDELLAGTRELDGQQEKRNPLDFAIWKKAEPSHIMRWPSPWGEGFPGWHLECSAMSQKYLGQTFDIHGGGMDLMFPHHECEIAQSNAACGHDPAQIWMHCNMVTVNGQKMGKSLGNAINLQEFFSGQHPLLQQAYTPMTIRFFMLQAHYRSTLDFSNDGLLAASKGYRRLMNGLSLVNKLTYAGQGELDEKQEAELLATVQGCYDAMNDDLNTAMVLANLSGLLKRINQWQTKPDTLGQVTEATFQLVQKTYTSFLTEVLGLSEEGTVNSQAVIEGLLDFYKSAKEAKDYTLVDQIRARFKQAGLTIKDTKTGIDWTWEE